jgi:hypothetical protein
MSVGQLENYEYLHRKWAKSMKEQFTKEKIQQTNI